MCKGKMATFNEYLYGFRDIYSDEPIGDAFYRDLSIDNLGLSSILDNDKPLMKNLDSMPLPLHVLPKDVIYRRDYMGQTTCMGSSTRWVFMCTSVSMLVMKRVWNDDMNSFFTEEVEASSGYVFKMMNTDNGVMKLLCPPTAFDALFFDTEEVIEGMFYSKMNMQRVPYMVERPIRDARDVKRLQEMMEEATRKHHVLFDMAFDSLLDVPVPLQRLCLRKNRRMWAAANRIAVAWARVYWDPTTYFGKRRMMRRFAEP